MRTIAIGGNSRSVGKTSLAVSIIGATRDLDWTAVKMTQFGHGICSRDGRPCGCAVEDPLCPYEISEEHGEIPTTDTARMLAAGASEVLWVRTALGRLEAALPAIRQRLEGKRHVLFESTSLVGHWPPDVFLAVLDYQNLDIKESVIRLAPAADAFILPRTEHEHPPWPEFDATLVEQKTDLHRESSVLLHSRDHRICQAAPALGPLRAMSSPRRVTRVAKPLNKRLLASFRIPARAVD